MVFFETQCIYNPLGGRVGSWITSQRLLDVLCLTVTLPRDCEFKSIVHMLVAWLGLAHYDSDVQSLH